MEEGKFYIIQKPIRKDEYSFVPNEKTKPVKISTFNVPERKQEYKKLRSIISNLEQTLDSKKDSNTTLKSFKDIVAQFPRPDVASLTSKVNNISKDVRGTYGIYNIVKLKDITNKSMISRLETLKLMEK